MERHRRRCFGVKMSRKGTIFICIILIGLLLCGCTKEKGKLENAETEIGIPSKILYADGSIMWEVDHLYDEDVDNYIIRCILDALMRDSGYNLTGFPCIDTQIPEKEFEVLVEKYCKVICNNGYIVKTSIDRELCEILKKSIQSQTTQYVERLSDGKLCIEAGAVCCDKKTGKVVAYVSGRDSENVVEDSLKIYSYSRRPGSAMKPLVVYAPLIERGYSAGSSVIDKQYNENVTNYDKRYEGKVTLEYAVAKSKNTVACEMLSIMGPEIGIDYLKKMHFDYITEEDVTPYAAIGLLQDGVTIPQMCSGFATLADGGVYHLPTCIVSIEDGFGNILQIEDEGERIYSFDAAEEMTEILKKVFVYGTAKGMLPSGLDGAGKTGTTAEGYDGWMCGYSGDYVTTVWVGAAQENSKTHDMAGNGCPALIWNDFYAGLIKRKKLTVDNNTICEFTDEEIITETTQNENDTIRMISNYIKSMNLKEKVYQLFIVVPEQLGLSEEEIKKGSLRNVLMEKPVGGLIFFERHLEDTEQTKSMTSSIDKDAFRYEGSKLFMCIDEEGGEVVRIADNHKFGVKNIGIPSDMESEKEVYKNARYIGDYLNNLGFNVDFAPDVDLYYEGSFLKKRTFSQDERIVSKLAGAYIQGLHSENVWGCYKHFPGIGSVSDDMHKGCSEISKKWDELKVDLYPFSEAETDGVEFCMVGHVTMPEILGDGILCSYSEEYINGVLRNQFGYDGIVITDAMDMAVITDNFTAAEASVLMILGGCDMLLMPEDLDLAVEGIIDAVERGIITEERLNESLERIFRLKFK